MRSNPLKESSLLHLARLGDKKAFSQLASDYYTKIYFLVNYYVNEPATASDLTQDVFLKVYQYLGAFREDSQFSTWIYRIALNTIKSHFHRESQHRECHLDVDLIKTADDLTPEDALIEMELGRRIDAVYEKLPDKLEQCYRLHAFDGESYQDIAERLDCPIGTVRSRISRAKHLLRHYLSTSEHGFNPGHLR